MYLAGAITSAKWIIDRDQFFDLNVLESFAKSQTFETPPQRFRGFILDSGAYTVLAKRKAGGNIEGIDWHAYVDRYADLVMKHQIGHYIELDIDPIVGLAEVERLRERLERRVGWPSMPAWHIARGAAKWDEIIRSHPYVCIGGFVTREVTPAHHPAIRGLLHQAFRRGVKVHGLGVTRIDQMKELPFWSVDSTTWLATKKFGGAPRFNGETVERIYREGCRNNGRAVLVQGFYEWVKFANYMEDR